MAVALCDIDGNETDFELSLNQGQIIHVIRSMNDGGSFDQGALLCGTSDGRVGTVPVSLVIILPQRSATFSDRSIGTSTPPPWLRAATPPPRNSVPLPDEHGPPRVRPPVTIDQVVNRFDFYDAVHPNLLEQIRSLLEAVNELGLDFDDCASAVERMMNTDRFRLETTVEDILDFMEQHADQAQNRHGFLATIPRDRPASPATIPPSNRLYGGQQEDERDSDEDYSSDLGTDERSSFPPPPAVNLNILEVPRPVSALSNVSGATTSEKTCVICITDPPLIAALPCGHLVLCMDCHKRGALREGDPCPLCRTAMAGIVRIWV